MKDEELKFEEIEDSHYCDTRWSGGSHQGRGERRDCRCYSDTIHIHTEVHQSRVYLFVYYDYNGESERYREEMR